ncbi:MAG: hypothetical protein SFV22_07015 [Saprospiraceae bacterium]|nr:hypothetical protein [Saprospiraceae bacterium]
MIKLAKIPPKPADNPAEKLPSNPIIAASRIVTSSPDDKLIENPIQKRTPKPNDKLTDNANDKPVAKA